MSILTYNTRNCNDFVITDICNTSQMLNTILYKGLLQFNNLPSEIKNCDTLKVFKRLLKTHILLVY